jgi:hypothetical protein
MKFDSNVCVIGSTEIKAEQTYLANEGGHAQRQSVTADALIHTHTHSSSIAKDGGV